MPEGFGRRTELCGACAKDRFEVTSGEPKVYVTKADSGEDAARAFCPDCGSPLWSNSVRAPFIPVKLGALDDNLQFAPSLHLYTASTPAWHLMHEGVPTFPKMPPLTAPEV